LHSLAGSRGSGVGQVFVGLHTGVVSQVKPGLQGQLVKTVIGAGTGDATVGVAIHSVNGVDIQVCPGFKFKKYITLHIS